MPPETPKPQPILSGRGRGLVAKQCKMGIFPTVHALPLASVVGSGKAGLFSLSGIAGVRIPGGKYERVSSLHVFESFPLGRCLVVPLAVAVCGKIYAVHLRPGLINLNLHMLPVTLVCNLDSLGNGTVEGIKRRSRSTTIAPSLKTAVRDSNR